MENSGNKPKLRLWLRWRNCTTRIENEIRRRLREQFQVTLPQFDLLSALERTDEPMTMSELSQYLLVSNGNVTNIEITTPVTLTINTGGYLQIRRSADSTD